MSALGVKALIRTPEFSVWPARTCLTLCPLEPSFRRRRKRLWRSSSHHRIGPSRPGQAHGKPWPVGAVSADTGNGTRSISTRAAHTSHSASGALTPRGGSSRARRLYSRKSTAAECHTLWPPSGPE